MASKGVCIHSKNSNSENSNPVKYFTIETKKAINESYLKLYKQGLAAGFLSKDTQMNESDSNRSL